MKQPHSSEFSENMPTKNGLRLFLTLGAIGLAGICGYHVGRTSGEEKIGKLQDSISKKDEKLAGLAQDSHQCRQAVRRLTESGHISRQQFVKIEEQYTEPDEDRCDAILRDAAQEKAKKLAESLCIHNPDDIGKLAYVMRQGYTEVLSVSTGGRTINLKDASRDSDAENYSISNWGEMVVLDEPAECAPEELMNYDPASDDELESLQELHQEGDYEAILRDFNLESACPSEGLEDPDELMECGVLSELTSRFAEESDPEARAEIICDSIASVSSERMETPDSWDFSKWKPFYEYGSDAHFAQRKREKKKHIYINAAIRASGLSTSGSEDEAVMHCFLPYYKNTQMCECPEEAVEEVDAGAEAEDLSDEESE